MKNTKKKTKKKPNRTSSDLIDKIIQNRHRIDTEYTLCLF